MRCSWNDERECGKHPTQVVLGICGNQHIKERVLCDMHASDWTIGISLGNVRCTECYEPLMEAETKEIRPGYKL
jgi:hypothetical protein